MSGHSKWANTRYRKLEQDIKRSKIFTKVIREIVSAVRLGGKNPHSNPRLRIAISKALSYNMNSNTLKRAISRGCSCSTENNMETLIYEGYTSRGIAIIVECLSNNRKRTASDIRFTFNKYGGNLSVFRSASYLFKKQGILSFKEGNQDQIIDIVTTAGAEDISIDKNNKIKVYITWEKISKIYDVLSSSNLRVDNIETLMIPNSTVNMNEETSKDLLRFVKALEDNDDVQEVYHNGVMF